MLFIEHIVAPWKKKGFPFPKVNLIQHFFTRTALFGGEKKKKEDEANYLSSKDCDWPQKANLKGEPETFGSVGDLQYI